MSFRNPADVYVVALGMYAERRYPATHWFIIHVQEARDDLAFQMSWWAAQSLGFHDECGMPRGGLMW